MLGLQKKNEEASRRALLVPLPPYNFLELEAAAAIVLQSYTSEASIYDERR